MPSVIRSECTKAFLSINSTEGARYVTHADMAYQFSNAQDACAVVHILRHIRFNNAKDMYVEDAAESSAARENAENQLRHFRR